MPAKILVVDDDPLLCHTLKYRLEREGYTVTTCKSGEEALSSARLDPPNLVLLDIGLPDLDGLAVARTLSAERHVPIIFLTARSQEVDIVVGLELGAEDYITKPFGMRELIARIRVVMRRAEQPSAIARESVIVAGDLALDPRAHTVHLRGRRVDLPPKEFDLLRLLMAHAGQVLSTDYLLRAVWGDDFVGAVQVLYVRIGWLREQVEDDPHSPRRILTVRGVGYKFAAEGEVP
jgi:DNA-binding response OmpR family regulator